MYPSFRSSLIVLAVATSTLLTSTSLSAQETGITGNPRTVLVTPAGEILDYIPADSDMTVRLNKRGRRVLVDSWGNVIATEMPRDRYRRLYDDNAVPEAAPGGDQAMNEDYFPEAPVGSVEEMPVTRGELGDVTGSIPEMPADGEPGIDQSMEEASLPGDMPSELPGADLPDGLTTVPGDQLPAEQSPAFPTISLKGKSRAEITALQVFLDREGISPGVIDGKAGSNVSKAVDSWQKMTGETLDVLNTEDILTRLGYSGGLPIVTYTITSADAAGPYVASIPEDYAHKAMLPAMSFTSVTEALAERFHMDETYLKELNPGVDFTIPGTIIKVVNPGEYKRFKVSRIVADKARKQVFAYDDAGTLVAAYPATIGSSDTPSPSGTHQVTRIALDPNYTYNPKINFQQGTNTKVLTIQPGPNTPVGSVWIALSKPTYGIHGTPEPSKIGKSQSHGCIRLTNWDARELAKMVTPGVTVEFID
jgi:lipoprotein-anchoring transpeptidase ErfK/SrfK